MPTSQLSPLAGAGDAPAGFFKKNWHLLALLAIAVLAFSLDFAAISKIGYGNGYYAAAIKSMSESFKNFFYASFDPAGVVTVDKPPLGLWVQTLFVLVFGYHGWAMLLPQALSATGACVLMYALTAKYFGRVSGLVAALVFAVTPAVVVAARNNTMDMQLIFVLEAAAWFLFKSIETSKWRHLFICAVLVGLGFNIKMLQAYMILPAVVLVYLVFAKGKFMKRLAAGAMSLVMMAVISFAWVVAVDLTPASSRPYVGSSTNNTVIELILGHNGMERLFGQGGVFGRGSIFTGRNDDGGSFPGAFQPGAFQPGGSFRSEGGFGTNRPTGQNQSAGVSRPDSQNQNAGVGDRPFVMPGDGMPNDGMPNDGIPGDGIPGGIMGGMDGMDGMGGGGNEIGRPGALRLWTQSLYGQASWLIVLAAFCLLVKLGKPRLKNLDIRHGVLAFWTVWLVTMLVFFSFASFWHRYYLCMIAPGVAGLCGIGIPEMVRFFRDGRGWKQILLPLSLLCTFAVEIVFVWRYAALRSWLAPLMIAAAAAALLMMALRYMKFIKPKKLIASAAAGLTLLALLAAPFYWSLTAVLYVEQNSTLPYAGPELASETVARNMTPNQEVMTTADSATVALENYLVAHYKPGSYLVVSQRANDVAQFIVDTGLPAVAYGGFLGSDNAITLERFKQLVAEGKITYFLMTSQGVMGGGSSGIAAYVRQNAAVVSPADYLGSTKTDSRALNGIGGATLYRFGV